MNEGKTDGTDTTILSLSISNAVDTDEGRFSAIALAGVYKYCADVLTRQRQGGESYKTGRQT